jgi:hypothetical protein
MGSQGNSRIKIMSSFIQPVRPIDTAPPWNWNPGQTFVTAFNESRLAKQKADEMRLSNELETILLPYKQKQAALALDKMQLDMELQSARIDREREATKQSYRQEIDRMKGISNPEGSGSSNPYDIFRDETVDPTTGEEAATSTMDLSGFKSADTSEGEPSSERPSQAAVADSGSLDEDVKLALTGAAPSESSSSNPLYDMPEVDTSRIPASGMLADASSELSPTAMSAMQTATDAASQGSSSKPWRLETAGVDLSSLPEVADLTRPNVSIDDAPAQRQGRVSFDNFPEYLTRRQLLKRQYDGLQNVKNYRLDPIKIQEQGKWEQATAKALSEFSALGVSDAKTLDALTELPADQQRQAGMIVQQRIQSGEAPNWTEAIGQVTGNTSEALIKKRDTALAAAERATNPIIREANLRQAAEYENQAAGLSIDPLELTDLGFRKLRSAQAAGDKVAIAELQPGLMEIVNSEAAQNNPGIVQLDRVLANPKQGRAVAEQVVERAKEIPRAYIVFGGNVYPAAEFKLPEIGSASATTRGDSDKSPYADMTDEERERLVAQRIKDTGRAIGRGVKKAGLAVLEGAKALR